MTNEDSKQTLRVLYRDLCLKFFGTLKAFSLYGTDHPETMKKAQAFFENLERCLSQKPTMTWLLIGGEVVIENQPLPELEKVLKSVFSFLEKINLERLTFRKGIRSQELMALFQLLISLLKDPSGGEMILSKNQEKLPHILAGRLPLESPGPITVDEFAGVLKPARQAVLSCSAQLKDLFEDIRGPLSQRKVSAAKDLTREIHRMVKEGDTPLKLLLYRRSPDPDLHIHALNVSALCMALAEEVPLEQGEVEQIGLGALLHDVGLIHPDADLFSTTGALSLDEKNRFWEHPARGAEILLVTPGLPDVIPVMAYEHHIHYNGKGFPSKQTARELNVASMIACIVDCYDSLRRNRPEERALSLAEALNLMEMKMGERFHPLLLKRFRTLVKAQAGPSPSAPR